MTAGADDFISKTNFNTVLIPKVFSMLRLHNLRKELVGLQELKAVRTLVNIFKHEFNNKLMIMNGNVFKVKKALEGKEDKAIMKIEDAIKFITDTIQSIEKVDNLSTEDYDSQAKIYKVK